MGSDQQLWLLRRFLKKNAVPVVLSNRIRRYVEHTLNKQKDKSSMKDVQALAVLSSRLMEELHCALNLPHMITHPIFKFLSDVSMRNMQQLVEKAVKRVQLAPGDVLFQTAEKASAMYSIVSGHMIYTFGQEIAVRQQEWLSEQVLWTVDWVHQGDLMATRACELLAIDPLQFEQVLSQVTPLADLVAKYAQQFLSWLNSQPKAEHSDLMSLEAVRSFLPEDPGFRKPVRASIAFFGANLF